MSLIRNNQSDVRKHLSSHGKKHLHLVGSTAEPKATDSSRDGPASTEPNGQDTLLRSAADINSNIDPPSDGLPVSAVTQKPQA
jgi:hypothetical protein